MFMLSPNLKEKQQLFFKAISKIGGKYQAIDTFTHAELFTMWSHFFVELSHIFLKSFALNAKMPVLNFSNSFLWVILIRFVNFEAKLGRNGWEY